MSLTIDDRAYTTVNFDRDRAGNPLRITPTGILLHHGGGTVSTDMFELTGKDKARLVSVGQYTGRDGTIYQLGPEDRRYWHAGAPDHDTRRWHGNSPAAFGIYDGNLLLGMETEHKPGQNWPDVQLEAIGEWARQKIEYYRFPITHIGAHKWYAPSRKDDPADFPDGALMAWIRTFYKPVGFPVRVTEPLGARIRTEPNIGPTARIVTTLPEGYVFWSDEEKLGQPIAGEGRWFHFAGPTPEIANPLGFVFGGICERVA